MILPRPLAGLALALLLALPASSKPVPTPKEYGLTPAGMGFVTGETKFEMGIPAKTLDKWFRGRANVLELITLESPEHKTEIEPFFLDLYEVTNAQYLKYLESAHKDVLEVQGNLNTLARIAVELYGQADEDWWVALYQLNAAKINPEKKNQRADGQPETDWATNDLKEGTKLVIYRRPVPKHWIPTGTMPKGLADHPVMSVSWRHANEYAAWAGKHLPLELEWERAARGDEGFHRTWGGKGAKDDWKKKEDRLNWSELDPRHPARNKDPSILTTPVGSFPDGESPFGMLDMLGNVWEWTDTTLDAYPGAKVEREDWWGAAKVIRGGAYTSFDFICRTTFRTGGFGNIVLRPDDAYPTIGFRCARWVIPGRDRAFQAWRSLEADNRLPKDGNKAIEFDLRGGIGAETTRYEIQENHVFVTGGVRSVAILPRANLSVSFLKELNTEAEKAEGIGVVVGLVRSDLDLAVSKKPVNDPATEVEGVAPAGDYVLGYHDGRLVLLKPKLTGLESVGYLTSKRMREELGPVVEIQRLKEANSRVNLGYDRVDVVFPVDKKRAQKDRFVFRAALRTAQPKVLTIPEWKDHKAD